MRLDGKIGIVTAAASGMGRAGALRFAREGAAVGVVDLDQSGVDAVVGEITAAGGRALGLVGDLRQDDFARSIVRRTANAFGGLDFVWNHVGHPGPASIEGIDMADYEIAIDLNLRTVLVTTEAAIPELRARGGGSLLYTASTSGIQCCPRAPIFKPSFGCAIRFGNRCWSGAASRICKSSSSPSRCLLQIAAKKCPTVIPNSGSNSATHHFVLSVSGAAAGIRVLRGRC